ncbi:secretion protein HlyD family protein [Oscillochloris trichoides DG-6]|uniref:Secretion protein HlyD family protein n=1 Tax=Oscillochloris trichoides DG-6 TaxID=765420 RepID=E1I9P2_9CHLR|nr:efflux RND transporter periplasmic adaptor subunit [Oscillochloris trichoides]EFO82120.1 secretion protein HlyD family protein [Oscillochloris trichoides DG-6]
MQHRARIIIPILVLAALMSGGYWWRNQQTATAGTSALSGSGTIEAEEVLVSSEVAGRVQTLLVDEGDEVEPDQILATLDPALLQAQRDQAAAGVAVAEANLALLQAGSRPEDVAAAQAALAQAQALRDGAAAAHANALEALRNPQQLTTQVVQARATRDSAQRALEQVQAGSRSEDLAAAEAQLAQAQTNLQATRDRLSMAKTQAESVVNQAANNLRNAQDAYSRIYWENRELEDRGVDVPQAKLDAETAAQRAVENAQEALNQAQMALESAVQNEQTGVAAAESQVATMTATVEKLRNGPRKEDVAAAQTALTNAQRVLDQMLAMRSNPQQLQAAVDAAAAQLAAADAQVSQAQARVELAQAGARPEQVQAAQAQLSQAQANLRQIEVQLAKATLRAPRAGLVLTRPIHEGEQVLPGTVLMTIGSLETVRLTLYIAEPDIGRVFPGQQAQVTVDSFPDRVFTGVVTYIAQEAEFTPRNVQTQDERATTVFAVQVEIENPDHALKPGMPADGVMLEGTSGQGSE